MMNQQHLAVLNDKNRHREINLLMNVRHGAPLERKLQKLKAPNHRFCGCPRFGGRQNHAPQLWAKPLDEIRANWIVRWRQSQHGSVEFRLSGWLAKKPGRPPPEL